jgi:oxaloacetate decarboxylase alpha subunit
MEQVKFVDTTLRDGPQSLWAGVMRTGMILPIAHLMDRIGFDSIELSPGTTKQFVRDFKEDPWERVRLVAKHIAHTPLRTNGAGSNAGGDPFRRNPAVLAEVTLRCYAANGIQQVRISDSWNQLAAWKVAVDRSRAVGLTPIINLIYTESPKHTDAHFAQKTADIASLQPFRICLKDPGGLLTPDRMRTLVPAMQERSGGVEIELHSHCTTGLGPLVALEAVRLGIRVINTAVPPLADGASLPSLYNVARNVAAMGFEPVYDHEAAKPIEDHFTWIARHEGLPIGAPAEFDLAQYHHQVPGGMISNLRRQLRQVGLEHQLPQTLEEAVRVRAEFGYPVMVTPLSQFVGSQAGINVIVGERYREVTDQTILYALGTWGGDEAVQAMDPNVRDTILNRPRARELARIEYVEPTLDDLRAQFGGPSVPDEELLIRYAVSEEELAAMRAAGPVKEYTRADAPLVTLLQELERRNQPGWISIEKKDFSLTIHREGRGTGPGGNA